MKKGNDGRYRSKVVVGHNAEGKPITKWVTGRTKKEYEAKAAELKSSYIGGQYVDRGMMFETYAEQWYILYKKTT